MVKSQFSTFRRLFGPASGGERAPSDRAWLELLCKSYRTPPVFHNGRALPGFPSDQMQLNTTGSFGVDTLGEAFEFYRACLRKFAEFGRVLDRNSTLLDFGAGWGRITRFFLREVPLERIYGIDVVAENAQFCREAFASPNFLVTSAFPPTNLQDEAFTHVVGYSVFSHLSEEACWQWMEEFHRLLVPGGIVALTTRPRGFFDYCESLRNESDNLTGYLRGLASLFEDFGAARKRYDSGQFVHSNHIAVSGGGAMTSEFYGETFIPEAYAASAYSDRFDFLEYLSPAGSRTQPILFFRRK
jgi:hypothetical protein